MIVMQIGKNSDNDDGREASPIEATFEEERHQRRIKSDKRMNRSNDSERVRQCVKQCH